MKSRNVCTFVHKSAFLSVSLSARSICLTTLLSVSASLSPSDSAWSFYFTRQTKNWRQLDLSSDLYGVKVKIRSILRHNPHSVYLKWSVTNRIMTVPRSKKTEDKRSSNKASLFQFILISSIFVFFSEKRCASCICIRCLFLCTIFQPFWILVRCVCVTFRVLVNSGDLICEHRRW